MAKESKSTTKQKTPKLANKDSLPKITVIGVGGSGKNAVNYMMKKEIKGIKFVAVNTDAQDLDQSKASKKIHIGTSITAGAGTGMDPEIGREAAIENKEDIAKVLEDTSIVFITGGMGGGTGTGASPIIAQIAKEMGILTVGVVTKPFSFEGRKRMQLAVEGIEELGRFVDAYIVIPNDKILEVAEEHATMNDAFALSDQILEQAVSGISNLITTPGRINIDESDVRTVLENQGLALVGIGKGSGNNRAEEAACKAIRSPLLDVSVEGARSVLFSISAGNDLKMSEVARIAETITSNIEAEATVKFGTIRDLKLKKGEIKVTVVASGFQPDLLGSHHSGQASSTTPHPNQEANFEKTSSTDIFKEIEEVSERAKGRNKSTVLALDETNTTKDSKETSHKKEEKKTPPSATPQPDSGEEDFWSLPSFLKR